MDSRERIDTLFRGGRPDRTGLYDSPWSDTLGAWLAEGYPAVPRRLAAGDRRWGEDGRLSAVSADGDYPEPRPPWQVFGFDMVQVGGWFDWAPRRGVSELLEETEEWDVRRNGAGAALKYWKHKSGTPEHVDFLMTTREVWERDYRPLLLDLDPLRLDPAGMRAAFAEARAAGAWTFCGHLGVWEILRASLGDLALFESLLLDPAWIADVVDVYTGFFIRHYGALFAAAGTPDGTWIYDDLGYRNGPFAAPDVLDRLVFPYYRRLVEWFHGLGMTVVLHSCGSQRDILPLVVDAGFDALNPMERKALGNDPFAFAERWGERLAFVGGLDARLLETNDEALVRRETAAYVDGMKARGARLVFGTDHSVSPRVRLSTFRAAVEAWRERAAY